MTVDYGNARIAARRARLLDRAMLERLAAASSTAEFLALLDRHEDWRPVVRGVAALGVESGRIVDAAIEHHRAERLGGLPAMYGPHVRRLVEALVVPLDMERALAILRRRHAGESAEAIGTSISAGALLDPVRLGRLARAPLGEPAARVLAETGLITPADAPRLAVLMNDSRWDAFEAAFRAATERARRGLAAGRRADAAAVRAVLDREAAGRAAVADAVAAGGWAAGVLIERSEALARLDDLARRGRRDPLGIGTVIGYVAAVEGQAIRLRAALAAVRAGWTAERARPYLGWSAA